MYESFYKLRKPPFRLTPDPHFFFGSRTHKRGLAYLRYAVQQGEGFVVITGGPGTGKTELMLNLLEEQLHPSTVFAKIVSSNLNADDLLELVAASFGVTHEGLGKGAILKKLENFLIARSREGKQVLLLIDEAHNLSTTSLIELSMLSNFQLGEKALLQCFLLGQEALEKKLQKPDLVHLKQRVIASTHLDPMDEIETREYINHRLTQAGWENDPQFHDCAYPLIHTFTGGIPRQINSLCNRLLLQGFIDETHEIDLAVVRNVIAEVLEEVAVAHAPYTVREPAIDSFPSADVSTRRHNKPRAPSTATSASVIRIPTAQPTVVATTMDGTESFTKQTHIPQEQKPSNSIQDDKARNSGVNTIHAGIEDADALHELARHGAGRLLHTLTGDSQLDRKLRASVAFYVNSGLANGASQATGRELSLLASPSVVDHNNPSASVWKWAAVAGISVLALIIAPQLRFTDEQIITRDTPSSGTTTKQTAAATDQTQNSALDASPKTEQPTSLVMHFDNDNTIFSDIANAIDTTQNDVRLVTPAETPAPKVETTLSAASAGPAEQLVQKQDRMPETATELSQKTKTKEERPYKGEQSPVAVTVARSNATPASHASHASHVNSPTKKLQHKPLETKSPLEKHEPTKLTTTTKKSTIATSSSPTIRQNISTPAAILPAQTLASVIPDVPRPKHTASPTRQNSHAGDRLSSDPVKPVVETGTSITPADLDRLVSTLASAYEAGNLRKLVSVFADNARSNDSDSIDEIEDDYRQLFNVTDMRRMVISGIQWSKLKDQMRGKGKFQLHVREKGAGRITSYDGRIRFDVMKSPQGVHITQLNYRYNEL